MMMKTVSLALAAMLMVLPSADAGKKLSSSSKYQSKFFSLLMEDGDEDSLLTHGPFTISAACGTMGGESRVRLLMTVDADGSDDEFVYGFPDFPGQDYYNTCIGTTAAGTTSDTCIVWSTGSGVGEQPGAFTSLSGYSIGLGASNTIGFSKTYLSDAQNLFYSYYQPEEVAAFPSECAISGEITYNKA